MLGVVVLGVVVLGLSCWELPHFDSVLFDFAFFAISHNSHIIQHNMLPIPFCDISYGNDFIAL